MKLFPTLGLICLFCRLLFAGGEDGLPAEGEQAPKQVPPAVNNDADPNSNSELLQPPQYLAKITRVEMGDKDGIVWGEAPNGLAIGIGKLETSLKSPIRPIIEIYLENRGPAAIPREVLRTAQFELTLNEQKHSFQGLINQLRLNQAIEPGNRLGPLQITTDQFRVTQVLQAGLAVIQFRPGPELTEGSHTLHLECQLNRTGAGSLSIAGSVVNLEVALSEYPVEDAVRMIRNELKDHSLSVQRIAAALAGTLHLADCRDMLIETLLDRDPYTRSYACKSLGELKDPIAVEPLKERLQDDSMIVRLQAARALTELGQPLEPVWLEPVIKSRRSMEFQGGINLAREKLGKRAVPLLIRCLDFNDPSTNNYYNYILVQQIGACGGPMHTYHRGRQRNGENKQQIEENRKVLFDLKSRVFKEL